MDSVLAGLVQYNHEHLQTLDMSFSNSVSQAMLGTLLRECVHIKRVSANFCMNVTKTESDGEALMKVVSEKGIDLQTVHLPVATVVGRVCE
jgi:hypothetical protein